MKKAIILFAIVAALASNGQTKTERMFIDRPKETIVNGHRLHVLGVIFTTYPPYYSCAFCGKECSPYDFLDGIRAVDSVYDKYGEATDSLFMKWWNDKDTSCISSEIEMRHSEDIWHDWLGKHEKGYYFLDTSSCMSTDGFYYVFKSKRDADKFDWSMAMGGRYGDKYLIADKWYKIIPFKTKRKK